MCARPLSLSPGIVAAIVVSACVAGGCRQEGRMSVTGRVRFADGKPLTRGTVRFEGKTRSGFAQIQPDGRYTLMAGGGVRGLLPGSYGVVVESTAEPPVWDESRKRYLENKPLIDVKYGWPATSGLSCDVKGATVFDIVVEPPKGD